MYLRTILLTSLLAIASIFISATPSMAATNCECYQRGYAIGAIDTTPGLKECMVKGKTQFAGQSTWTFFRGYLDGVSVESPIKAKARRHAKWAADRRREANRNRRLVCG